MKIFWILIVNILMLNGFFSEKTIGQEKTTKFIESGETFHNRVVIVMSDGKSFSGKLENESISVRTQHGDSNCRLSEISYIYKGKVRLKTEKGRGVFWDILEKELRVLLDKGDTMLISPDNLLFLTEDVLSKAEGSPLKMGSIQIISYDIAEDKSFSLTKDFKYKTKVEILDDYLADKIFTITNPIYNNIVKNDKLITEINIEKLSNYKKEIVIKLRIEAHGENGRGNTTRTCYSFSINDVKLIVGEINQIKVEFPCFMRLKGKGYAFLYIVPKEDHEFNTTEQVGLHSTISNVLRLPIEIE